jgi:hypothetical protein
LDDEQVSAITACTAAYLRGQQPSQFAVEWFGWVAAGAGQERRFVVPRSRRADALIVHLLESIQCLGIAPIDFHDEGEWWEWRVRAAGLVARTDREGGNAGWIGPAGGHGVAGHRPD